jgi:orotidine-5'-phosphate decarboxylase
MSSELTFVERLHGAWEANNSLLCVGLDPEGDRLPATLAGERRSYFAFCRAVIDATAPFTCAFKPQFAHFAAASRLDELRALCHHIRRNHPQHLLILDAKRGDIGSTAAYYAREAFAVYEADAVTVNPYLGGDTLIPFTEDPAHGVFILCKTSNPGSDDLQALEINGRPLYQHVAELAAGPWNAHGNVGLVAGATYPDELRAVRALAPKLPLLVPGIGAQGGDLAATLAAGLDADGGGLLINSSRGILYADSGRDFADEAAEAAQALHEAIQRLRGSD